MAMTGIASKEQAFHLAMEFIHVGLQTPSDRLDAVREFYAHKLGLEQIGENGVRVGVSELSFQEGGGRPFYHFAFLVPGDRFDAAKEWVADRVTLLGGGDIDGVVFDFENWNALALYFHDPAGNIVELIAHRELGQNGRNGSFDGSELLGLSEVGLVGEQTKLARGLAQLDLHLWDGELAPGRLAFFGERARTFIVASQGRGWLPTGQPAEAHPVEATISGLRNTEAVVGPHRIKVSEAEVPDR